MPLLPGTTYSQVVHFDSGKEYVKIVFGASYDKYAFTIHTFEKV
jgi:hypothetical protein